YIEIALLSTTTSSQVIKHLKSIFTRHGIPQIVVSDIGPQFSSDLLRKKLISTISQVVTGMLRQMERQRGRYKL
uniref:Integrase catalytic domain-containing protein n=1 Tax=Amphimedon queenslandica TaxID=400682 RepID=A0A1X7SRK9_AMPQE